ncbi:hypothetical protein E2C01_076377 [Portunus trituberculatus]|uniref:Uncharacterized protein n=1 Tax=Portunus trituberculatus TaxID=210409 RepID=A0A5B7INE0_PORTR|nr:hypothetical protein [Portunus trituberculatus]
MKLLEKKKKKVLDFRKGNFEGLREYLQIAWQGQGRFRHVEGREDQRWERGRCEVGVGRREIEVEGEDGLEHGRNPELHRVPT